MILPISRTLINPLNADEQLERIKRKAAEIKNDLRTITNAAKEINKKYTEEIEEGTRKRQLLIEDGKNRGLTEADVCKGTFLPTRQTPIMNWLYFMMREEGNEEMEKRRKQLNEEVGDQFDEYDINASDILNEEVKDFGDYIYGNVTQDMFQKIKKLKSLSKSPNFHEAFVAYTVCNELCKKFGLDFDKIPSYTEDK